MKAVVFENVCHASKEPNMDQHIFGRYINKLHQKKHNEMKPNCVVANFARSSVKKVGP